MIGFMPTIYPDELVYSWFARYYAHSGHSAYVFAIEDLLEKRNIRADVEFINRLNPAAKGIITKILPMEKIILEHTMFPYARFTPYSRRRVALQSMIEQERDAHYLLPIPKSRQTRYIRYCPMCALEDREKYGEVFWKRTALLRNVDVCARHGCRLKTTEIEISGKQSPRLYVAENEAIDMEPEMVEDGLELQFAKYLTEVFQAPVHMENTVAIGDFLNARLEGTKYISARGKMRNVSLLFHDITEFYKEFPYQGITELSQVKKIFTGYKYDFYGICQIAFLLDISAEDLINPCLPEKSQTERFNERVAELYEAGLGCHRIAREVHSSPATVLKANRVRERAEHNYSVRKGMKRDNWVKMDEELLQEVQKACEQIYHNNGGRPGRVTVFGVCKALNLPDKRFDYLPRCRAMIQDYFESYPVYWAREVIWAYQSLMTSDMKKDIYWRDIRNITNLKKNNFISSFPFLSLFVDEETAERIKNLV